MPTNERLLLFAKQMRHTPTTAERRLWLHLRAWRYQGWKFKRQQPIGPYIVDFVCFEQRLVVEVDGSQHIELALADEVRIRWLESRGFRVLRLWNDEVLGRTDVVLEEILRGLRHR